MKVVKINTEVKLTSDATLKPGSIAVIEEVLYSVKARKEIDGVEKIPCLIVAPVFESVEAYQKGVANVGGVVGYNSSINDAVIMKYYTVDSAETLAIEVVYDALNELFPDQVEVIDI